MRPISAVLEDYFAEHARCHHCGERPPMPRWRCCSDCWRLLMAGEPLPVVNPIREPDTPTGDGQLSFDQEAA